MILYESFSLAENEYLVELIKIKDDVTRETGLRIIRDRDAITIFLDHGHCCPAEAFEHVIHSVSD
jgi:hypothetical protein